MYRWILSAHNIIMAYVVNRRSGRASEVFSGGNTWSDVSGGGNTWSCGRGAWGFLEWDFGRLSGSLSVLVCWPLNDSCAPPFILISSLVVRVGGMRGGGVPTLVTPLHVCLQTVCSPLSFLRLFKRETCLILNVNFWILSNTAVLSQMYFWSLLLLKSKALTVLLCKSFKYSNAKCSHEEMFVLQISLKWAL